MNRTALLALLLVSAHGFAAAEEPIDLTILRQIPLHHRGRVMPFDSFANASVETICESSKGKLVSKFRMDLCLTGFFTDQELANPRFAGALELFPEGRPRAWSAPELVLSWMAEPEKWEEVPFLGGGHEELRRLLGEKSFDAEPDVIAIYRGKEYRLLWIGHPQPRPPEELPPAEKIDEENSHHLLPDAVLNAPADEKAQTARPKLARLQALDHSDDFVVAATEIKLKDGSQLPDGSAAATGHRLKYVSPRCVRQSQALLLYYNAVVKKQDWVEELANRGIERSAALDKEVIDLLQRYKLYRCLTFDPRANVTLGPIPSPGDRLRFGEQLNRAWLIVHPVGERGERDESQSMPPKLELLEQLQRLPAEAVEASHQLQESLKQMANVYVVLLEDGRGEEAKSYPDGVPTKAVEKAVLQARASSRTLARVLEKEKDAVYQLLKQEPSEQLRRLAPLMRELAYKCKELSDICQELHLALFDNQDSLLIVPAMNAAALSAKRDAKDQLDPWLSLSGLLYGSDELLDFVAGEKGYPRESVDKVRTTYETLMTVYRRRGDADRPAAMISAQNAFAAALQELAAKIEPRRKVLVEERLKASEKDKSLLLYTEYPPAGQTLREVTYNTVDPFKWSWLVSLLGLCVYALAGLPALRGRVVGVAFAIQAASILWTIYAFYLRISITGFAPVTNMFETVVFVPFVAAVLGAWFLVLPMIWTGLEAGWRLAACPFTFEEAPLTPDQASLMSQPSWRMMGFIEQIPRIGIMVFLFLFLAVWKYGDGERTLFNLLPDLTVASESASGALNKIVVWVVGLVVLGISLWIVPRIVLTFVNAVVLVPWTWAADRERLGRWQEETADRWLFGLAGTAVAAASTWVAWSAPANVLDEAFGPLQPVLRSNFWLTIHVLTIVASYGAGMLALILGNVALFFYLIGPYRQPEIAANPAPGFGPAKPRAAEDLRQPMKAPEVCHTLAEYCYRVVQVAVLLLATGTILGGLWADVSWGRFWGWDPKEVWALVTLLVYLAILHGRFAGWFNDFGMIFGTVFGATTIMMSWYGVNFVLPMIASGASVGLHSYGVGAGGQEWVFSIIGLNWLFLAAASVRYWYESSLLVEPRQVELTMPAIDAQLSGSR